MCEYQIIEAMGKDEVILGGQWTPLKNNTSVIVGTPCRPITTIPTYPAPRPRLRCGHMGTDPWTADGKVLDYAVC